MSSANPEETAPAPSALTGDVMRAVVDAAPDGLLIVDENGRIALVNSQVESLFGYHRGDLLGREIEMLIPHPNRNAHTTHRVHYAAAPRGRAMGSGLLLNGLRSDGSEVPVEVALSPLRTDDGLFVIATVRDVTDRTAKEIELERDRRTRFVEALAAVSKTLLGERDGDEAIPTIAARARSLLDADAVLIAVIDESAGVVRIIATDSHAHIAAAGLEYPAANSLTQEMVRTNRPIRASGCQVSESPLGPDNVQSLLGPGVGAPLRLSTHESGAIWVSRVPGRPEFDDRDIQLLASYASQVAIAIELADARADQQRLALLEDRERIGRDLHDLVIQHLFAVGLSLQATASRATDPVLAARVIDAVGSIDSTIGQIRTTIFQLGSSPAEHPIGLRHKIVTLLHEMHDILGFEPRLRFDGIIDTVPDDIAEHLLATLNEALSNVARHANASSAEVRVEGLNGQLALRVADNGIGLPPTLLLRGRGLDNIISRAQALGGEASVHTGTTGGTIVTWSAPLPL